MKRLALVLIFSSLLGIFRLGAEMYTYDPLNPAELQMMVKFRDITELLYIYRNDMSSDEFIKIVYDEKKNVLSENVLSQFYFMLEPVINMVKANRSKQPCALSRCKAIFMGAVSTAISIFQQKGKGKWVPVDRMSLWAEAPEVSEAMKRANDYFDHRAGIKKIRK